MTPAQQVYVLRLMPVEWWDAETDDFRARVTADCIAFVAARAARDGVHLLGPGQVELETTGDPDDTPPYAVFTAQGVRAHPQQEGPNP